MKSIDIRININRDRILLYNIELGNECSTYSIKEGYIKNGDVVKSFSLTMRDDYNFIGSINDNDDVDKIYFEFDIDHPLFLPLFHLLNYDESLIIDDDDSTQDNIKYLEIYYKDAKIYMNFIDKTKEKSIDSFQVFIKNIDKDGRSKIERDEKDTKRRLLLFFDEVNDILVNNEKQITMEEYLLKKSKGKSLTKSFKRII